MESDDMVGLEESWLHSGGVFFTSYHPFCNGVAIYYPN